MLSILFVQYFCICYLPNMKREPHSKHVFVIYLHNMCATCVQQGAGIQSNILPCTGVKNGSNV